MFLYLSFIGGTTSNPDADPEFALEPLRQIFANLYPNISMARMVVMGLNMDIADMAITLGSTVALALISYGLASVSYARGMSSQLEESRKISTQKVEFVQNSAFKAFISKEFKEIFRNPGLAFYCLFQAIMAPLMLVFYGNLGKNIDGAQAAPEFNTIGTAMGFFFITLMVCGMNYTALSSVSREGKNFNMSKTLPAPYSYQIAAKIRVADIMLAGSIATSGLALIFLINANVLQTILFLGFALILGNAFNYYLAYRDARSPKLEWESITVALKDNKSVLWSMLISTAFAFPLIAAYLVITFATDGILSIVLFSVMWAVMYGLALLLNRFFRKRMQDNIETIIANLET